MTTQDLAREALIREAKEGAHEALRQAISDAESLGHPLCGAQQRIDARTSHAEARDAIDRLAALSASPSASPSAGAEPVAWMECMAMGEPEVGYLTDAYKLPLGKHNLYAAPATAVQAQPLTEAQIMTLSAQSFNEWLSDINQYEPILFARAIEAAHGITSGRDAKGGAV